MTTELDVLTDARRFRQAIVGWAAGYRTRRRAAMLAGTLGAEARAELLLWSKGHFNVEGGTARPAVH